jgi:L-iditol 2-dehydrogenase
MKVAMYYSNEDVRVEEMERPAPGPGEAVMKVMASGICGTDVMYWYRAHKVPMVLGHEVAGEIVEVGEGVTKLRPGDRVVAAHHVPCGSCHYCSDNHESVCDTLRSTNFHPGGFAEYLRLPKINVDMGTFPMPKDMSFDEGTFVEPLACVLRAQRAGRVSEGKSVLVIGSGISGLLHVALARARGAGFVASTDLVPFRLDLARKAGAGLTLDARGDVPSAFIEANGERGADTVILTAGAPAAIAQAPLPVNKLFWKQEVTLTSTYAASPAEHVEAMGLISSGRVRVEDLVTHVLPLEDAQEGFRLVSGGGDSAKVIIRPNG